MFAALNIFFKIIHVVVVVQLYQIVLPVIQLAITNVIYVKLSIFYKVISVKTALKQ